MAVIKSTQTGTVTIAIAALSATAAITPVVMANSILVFGPGVGEGTAPDTYQTSGQITSPSSLTFTRSATGVDSVPIRWYVAEFDSGVSVQRGAVSGVGNPINVTITAVDLAKAFVLWTVRTNSTATTSHNFYQAKLTTTTNLQFNHDDFGTTSTIEWQVVEITAGAAVQTGDVSFLSTDASKTATITSVNTAKAWLLFSYQTGTGTFTDAGRTLLRGVITDATTLTFDRNNTGVTLTLTWFVVEFSDSTTVQQGSEPFTTAELTRNVALTAIALNRSIATAGAIGYTGGRTPFSTAGNPFAATVRQTLTTTTNLELVRRATGTAACDIGWFVVEFAGPVGGGVLAALTTSVDVATTTAAKTLLQLTAPTNTALLLKSFGVGFKGVSATDAAIAVEILRQTTAGTGTSRAPKKLSLGNEPASTGAENFTAEPTAGDILWSETIHPQDGKEFEINQWIDGGGRVGLRVTAAVSVNARAHMEFVE